MMKDTETFDWGLYPEVEELLVGEVNEFLSRNRQARLLAKRMGESTSTAFIDWIDYISVPESRLPAARLEKLGFDRLAVDGLPEGTAAYKHMSTILFPVLVSQDRDTEVAIKPENIDDFAQSIGSGVEVDGEPFAPLRKATVSREGNYVLCAIERRGTNGYVVQKPRDIHDYVAASSAFKRRRRYFESDEDGFEYTRSMVSDYVTRIGEARTADAFFRAERSYWQGRNRAGQIQKSRQDTMGLGWGNHDHHTYRSSRENFARLISLFELMGYKCRERYYAGEKAGWGAQIMEHKTCEIVLFADVDLFPEETQVDFAHNGLAHRKELGTVGLWIGLHGESIFQAGMHHLEARFNFDDLKAQLPKYGVRVMEPFSYFDFLKQAFTEGEKWPVDPRRLDRLLGQGSINQEQYNTFRDYGAIGSHMENLQRNKGFKGFNKASVTKIIKATDPRLHADAGA